MLTILKLLSWLLLGAGIGAGIYRFVAYAIANNAYAEDKRYGGEERGTPPARPSVKLPIILAALGLVAVVALSGATQVPATHVAVIENTWTGQFYSLGPGTHIFPMEPRLVPLMTRVAQYDLRRRIIEIGNHPVREQGIQADSKSPGRPVVYFYARGWAYPNKEQIIELHRRYGADYLDSWVERVWVSSLKSVQGERPYDYVGNYRVAFQNEVEEKLQLELLLDASGTPLVLVSQLAIVDFDFDEKVNSYLNSVAQKEFERQQAEQQIAINKKLQEAATIEVETRYITTKRDAEAEQIKRITEAEGQAQAKERMADALAYETLKTYEAESRGIKLVQDALAQSPDAYLQYQRTRQWDGELPNYMFGNTPLPFITVPEESTR